MNKAYENLTKEQLAEKLESLENAKDSRLLNIKIGNKQNVVVGGPNLGQRFPVSLYAPSWLVLLDNAQRIREFIEEHSDELSWG